MRVLEVPRRKDFIHHHESPILDVIREVIFGAEDGMVSTVGSLTGIAVATSNPFTVLLAGFVIVTVESISMGVGSYLSNKSSHEVDQRKLAEERYELEKYPEEERQELMQMYMHDGWPKEMAETMAMIASKDKQLFLKEMVYRELHIPLDGGENPVKAGLFMFVSYIVGGVIPLLPYLFLPIPVALVISITTTFIGLFLLGVFTTRFSKRSWWKAGGEMLGLASLAAIAGYLIGQVADRIIAPQL